MRCLRWGIFAAMLALCPAGVGAQVMTAPDCAALAGRLPRIDGYEWSRGAPVLAQGWCVLEGAMLRAATGDRPDIHARSVRVRGVGLGGDMTALEVQATGVRVLPRIGDRTMDDRLRSFLRMQTADISATFQEVPERDTVEIREVVVSLPGRNRLTLGADVKGADLAAWSSFFGGQVTLLDLELVTDGRVARPIMQMAGERMVAPKAAKAETTEADALAAVRAQMLALVDAMPVAVLGGEGRFALTTLIAGLPQTTGTLTVRLSSEAGISAAAVAINGLRADPLAPQALAVLFGAAELTIDWRPGVGN